MLFSSYPCGSAVVSQQTVPGRGSETNHSAGPHRWVYSFKKHLILKMHWTEASAFLNLNEVVCFSLLRVFLVRDSQSNPRTFVLSLCHTQKIKHFQIVPVSLCLHTLTITTFYKCGIKQGFSPNKLMTYLYYYYYFIRKCKSKKYIKNH